MKKIVLGLTITTMMTLFAACTPSVGFSGPSLSVPINLDLTPEEKAQQETTQPAQAAQTPTQACEYSANSQCLANSGCLWFSR